jgi:hypothetical protein
MNNTNINNLCVFTSNILLPRYIGKQIFLMTPYSEAQSAVPCGTVGVCVFLVPLTQCWCLCVFGAPYRVGVCVFVLPR